MWRYWHLTLLALLLVSCSREKAIDMAIEIPSTSIRKSFLTLDPQSIKSANEATYAKLLFSPLVSIDENGEVSSVLASNFFWEKNELIIEINGEYKSISGRKLQAEDVYFSLVRMAEIADSKHGSLKQFLADECGRSTANCIEISDNRVSIKVKTQYKPFVLALLSNTESLILFKEYAQMKELPLEAFQETTGPYSIASWGDKEVVLVANMNHPFYTKDVPQKIKFRDIEGHNNLKEEFKLSPNMVIPGYISLNLSEFLDDGLKNEINIFQTQDIKLQYLTFTKEGMRRHSYKRRLAFTKKIGQIYQKYSTGNNGLKPYSYLFSLKRHGSLTDEQKRIIESNEKEVADLIQSEKGDGFTLSVPLNAYKDFFEKVLSKDLPNLRIIVEANTEYGKSGDFGWFFRDMSFFEDFSLLNYFLSTIAGFDEAQKKEWIDRYVSLDSPEARNKIVQDLHFQTISTGVTIPFCIEPYFVLSKKPWVILKSDLFADTPIWKMKRL